MSSLRPYHPADLEQIITLFTETVHTISSHYYSPEEVEAWAPSHPGKHNWAVRLSGNYTIVAENDGGITGFGSLDRQTGMVELLYTHHTRQNEGIGSVILDALEEEALQSGLSEVQLITSATAWPFYQKRGYDYYRSEKKAYGDILFDCQVLKKMLPVFRNVRRKDRVLEEEGILDLLKRGEYGFLSMCAVNGYGYGIPISYVFADQCIYFHCAPEGFKLDNIRKNNRVGFCVVGETQVIPGQFTTAYESALVFGRMYMDLPEEERHHALDLLVRKYSPEFVTISKTYISKSFHRTNILKLDIDHLSGKCKRIKPA